MPSSTGQETLSQGQPPSNPLLSPEFVQGLAWFLGLFGLGNGIEWVAGAYREKKT